jgi:hypothetical protein
MAGAPSGETVVVASADFEELIGQSPDMPLERSAAGLRHNVMVSAEIADL